VPRRDRNLALANRTQGIELTSEKFADKIFSRDENELFSDPKND
jgi:hypothetical protein